MPCGATQDGWVIVERSDRMWSTGEGNGKPLQYSCLENPMDNMKRLKTNKKTNTKHKTLIIREMLIETTMRYHLTLVRMAIIKKSTNNKC